MTYRPITDVWFLARAKLKGGQKYYGAYLGGFPERARALLGVGLDDPVLHVCGGMAKHYPYNNPGCAIGPHDETLDIDPNCDPDHLADARNPLPTNSNGFGFFRGYLIDPPYSENDAEQYFGGRNAYPKPNALVANAIAVARPGDRVGLIHYVLPRCPKHARFVAAIAVMCGFNNRIRCYSVFERLR